MQTPDFRKTDPNLYKRVRIATQHTTIRMEPNEDDVHLPVPGTPTVPGTPQSPAATNAPALQTLPGTPQSPAATNAPALQTLPNTPESPRYSPIDITPIYDHSVRALYDRRVRMHQVDTFWAVMQSIASERSRDNFTLTERVQTELRRCDQKKCNFSGEGRERL